VQGLSVAYAIQDFTATSTKKAADASDNFRRSTKL
jgi:hypothetical protein